MCSLAARPALRKVLQLAASDRVHGVVRLAGTAQLAKHPPPALHLPLALVHPLREPVVQLIGARDHIQHRYRDRPLLLVQIVAEALARKRLPIAVDR